MQIISNVGTFWDTFEQITLDYNDCFTNAVKAKQEICLIGGLEDEKGIFLQNVAKFEVKLGVLSSKSNIVKS